MPGVRSGDPTGFEIAELVKENSPKSSVLEAIEGLKCDKCQMLQEIKVKKQEEGVSA